MTKASRENGFTLVELLVVLALLGVLAAVVVPAIPGVAQDPAGSAARAVAGVYVGARDVAVTRGVPVTVVLDLQSGAYQVAADPGATGGDSAVASGSVRLVPGVRLASREGDTAFITFGPLGHARGDAVVARDDWSRYAIAVDPWTSDVYVRRR